MRISDWSSDVCSSDLAAAKLGRRLARFGEHARRAEDGLQYQLARRVVGQALPFGCVLHRFGPQEHVGRRSEEHTSELQSLLRISYAACCLTKKTHQY